MNAPERESKPSGSLADDRGAHPNLSMPLRAFAHGRRRLAELEEAARQLFSALLALRRAEPPRTRLAFLAFHEQISRLRADLALVRTLLDEERGRT